MEDTPHYSNAPSNFDRQHYRSTKNLFVALPLYFIRDEEVDGYMKAILTELLSYPENWIINKNQVMKNLQFPERKFNAAWKQLQEKGYISKKRLHRGVKWFVTDNPNNITDWRGNAAEEAMIYLKKGLNS